MTADTTPESLSEYTPTTEEVRIKYTLSSGRLPEAPAEFDRWLAVHDAEVARKAAEPFIALNEIFLHMRDRVAGYVGAPPVAGFFADGAAAFEWAATNIRRVRDGQSPLEPPTPEQSHARAEQIGENRG